MAAAAAEKAPTTKETEPDNPGESVNEQSAETRKKDVKVLSTRRLEKFMKKQNTMGVVSIVPICLDCAVAPSKNAATMRAGVHKSSSAIHETCQAETFTFTARQN